MLDQISDFSLHAWLKRCLRTPMLIMMIHKNQLFFMHDYKSLPNLFKLLILIPSFLSYLPTALSWFSALCHNYSDWKTFWMSIVQDQSKFSPHLKTILIFKFLILVNGAKHISESNSLYFKEQNNIYFLLNVV